MWAWSSLTYFCWKLITFHQDWLRLLRHWIAFMQCYRHTGTIFRNSEMQWWLKFVQGDVFPYDESSTPNYMQKIGPLTLFDSSDFGSIDRLGHRAHHSDFKRPVAGLFSQKNKPKWTHEICVKRWRKPEALEMSLFARVYVRFPPRR